MENLLSTNYDLEDRRVNQRRLNRRNTVNWRNWFSMLAIHLVSNGAFVAGQFPKMTFSLPQKRVNEFGGHQLTHFDVGEGPEEGSKTKEMRREF